MKEEVERAVAVLRAGGVILCPTDTVWGLSCDATNDEAVKKIFAIKQREGSKSLVTLVDSENMLNRYVDEVPAPAWDIIETAENPITIIYDDGRNLSKLVIAEDGSVGIRVTSDEFCKNVIRRLGKPIVSTSANLSGEPAPENFSEISAEIKSKADHIVNLRQKEFQKFKPSSIIKIGKGGLFRIIRK